MISYLHIVLFFLFFFMYAQTLVQQAVFNHRKNKLVNIVKLVGPIGRFYILYYAHKSSKFAVRTPWDDNTNIIEFPLSIGFYRTKRISRVGMYFVCCEDHLQHRLHKDFGDPTCSSFPSYNLTLVYRDQLLCLLYTSPSPRDRTRSRMPSSA